MPTITHNQMQTLLRNAGFPDISVDTYTFSPKKPSGKRTFDGKKPLIPLMSAIAQQESALRTDNSNCKNPSIECSVCLLQINTNVHKNYSAATLKANPEICLKEAYRIYKSQGLTAWGGYTDGRYKNYYNNALAAYGGSVSNAVVVTSANQVTDIANNLVATVKDAVNKGDDTTKIILYGVAAVVVLGLVLRR